LISINKRTRAVIYLSMAECQAGQLDVAVEARVRALRLLRRLRTWAKPEFMVVMLRQRV
jgi:hypothetical protein